MHLRLLAIKIRTQSFYTYNINVVSHDSCLFEADFGVSYQGEFHQIASSCVSTGDRGIQCIT